MKNKAYLLLALASSICLFSEVLPAQAPRITVLNPLGQPPPINKIPMAPRINNLEGKTIYIVDIAFTDTHQLFTEMQKLLSAKYPKTKWEVRTKAGAMIMGVGH